MKDTRITTVKHQNLYAQFVEESLQGNFFDSHMNNHNKTSHEEISLILNTEDSLWKFVCCEKCEERFENEPNLKQHIETFNCIESETILQQHTDDIHLKNLYGNMIRQNLKPSDLEE